MIRASIDNFKLALGTFVAHPMRTALTLLGIVIGVATVMTMMALLTGLREKVNRDFSQLGANVFRVDKWPQKFGFGSGKTIDWNRISRRPPLTVDDRRAVETQCPLVLRTAASSWQPGQRVRTAMSETQSNVFIIGATEKYPDTSGINIAEGRFFNESEELDGRRLAVLGPDVADKLFPSISPLGQEVRLKSRPYTVIGVMERRGKLMGIVNLDNQVLIPMAAFQGAYGKKRSISISVQAIDADNVDNAMVQVERVLRQRRDVPANDENNFEVSTNESMAKSLNDLSAVVMAATFGVCILSLLVGGIGILNIMLVSVTERTREIGIRKALGARRRRILLQFATEATMLSLIGGLIGIGIGFGLAFLGRWGFGLYTAVPLWSVLLSVGMSSGVGLIFGIYPAAKASKLDPVEAMRSE
jgi:putative ABC transport system permease protein